MLRSYHPAKFAKIWISVEKFKFSQILLGDKNATSLCSKNISTLNKQSLLFILQILHLHPSQTYTLWGLHMTFLISDIKCSEENGKFETLQEKFLHYTLLCS